MPENVLRLKIFHFKRGQPGHNETRRQTEHARVRHDRTCLLSGALSPFIFLTSPGIFDRQVI